MVYVYEFEIVKDEIFLVAIPYDLLGATQGEDEKEVADNAVDWLRIDIEHRLMNNIEIPEPTFGNTPRYGGRNLIVAIEASLETVKAVPAHEAADMLGVSRGRVSQMFQALQLDGYKKGRDLFITIDSIEARKNEAPKAGRPTKEMVQAREKAAKNKALA